MNASYASVPSKMGRFLEVTLNTDAILDSMSFYRDLGFREVEVGEIRSYPYAVMSDGRLFLGLHQHPSVALGLTYVLPELAGQLGDLRELGVNFESLSIQSDEFNEGVFFDPDRLRVSVLEARTFSPPNFDKQESFSCCGHFEEFGFPVRDLDRSIKFWEPLGFVATRGDDSASLIGDSISLGLHQGSLLPEATLTFHSRTLDDLIRRTASTGIAFLDVQETDGVLEQVKFRTPEQLTICVCTEESLESSQQAFH